MEQLPNLISCLRIALSVMLLFLTDKPALFVVTHFLCGISDILDGYIARRFDLETKLGIKLDSAGDFIFYVVWMFILATFINSGNNGLIIACVMAVAVIRITNLIITKAKFKQWSVMHSIGNKLTGFILFLVLPVYVFVSGVLSWAIITVSAIAAISALEESVILLKSKFYDANERSVFAARICRQ